MRVFASAASSNAPAASETSAVSLVQVVPPLVEYHSEPCVVSTKLTAMPVTVLSGSETLGLPPDRLTNDDTSMPTAPEGDAAFWIPLGKATSAERTAASLVPAMWMVTEVRVPSALATANVMGRVEAAANLTCDELTV